ncbi:hypothetical protein [Neobacillus drentensis]|uniref:hypothetical protein n=1 Tax=Neobacillus drentensis TaxID=220684 RepID=UPI002FFE49A7
MFYDDFDYEAYLQILEEARLYFPFYLLSYCLMTNHIHLQIETIHHHPKDRMKMFNSRYSFLLDFFESIDSPVLHMYSNWHEYRLRILSHLRHSGYLND